MFNRLKLIIKITFLAACIVLIIVLTFAYRHVEKHEMPNKHYTSINIDDELSINLKIMALNFQGKPFVEKDTYRRSRALGAIINIHDPDIIILQEMCQASDRERLLKDLEFTRIKHQMYFSSSVFGSGLYILSAYPFSGATFHRYRAGTPWYSLHQLDWWMGNGVGMARLDLGNDAFLDLFTFQLDANQNTHGARYRARQWAETLPYISHTSHPEIPTLVIGNTSVAPTELRWSDGIKNSNVLVDLLNSDSKGIVMFGYTFGDLFEYYHEHTETIDGSFEVNNDVIRITTQGIYLSSIRIESKSSNKQEAVI